MPDRDFKGVWIPKEIWLDTRLNMLDKGILVEIDSLDNGIDGCWASNDYLAEFCQCSNTKVSKAVSKLIELGYVTSDCFDGRKRKLQSCLAKNARLPSKKDKAAKQKMQESNIENNIENIYPYSPHDKKSEIAPGFDRFYGAYPKKVSKQTAVKAWNKLKPNEELIERIIADVNRRKGGEWRGKDKQYIPFPATYLNQRRWEDEHDTGVVEAALVERQRTVEEVMQWTMEKPIGVQPIWMDKVR